MTHRAIARISWLSKNRRVWVSTTVLKFLKHGTMMLYASGTVLRVVPLRRTDRVLLSHKPASKEATNILEEEERGGGAANWCGGFGSYILYLLFNCEKLPDTVQSST